METGGSRMIHDILRTRLLIKAGLYEPPPPVNLLDRFKTEWSPRFEQYMRNRLVMGSIRYETFADKRRKAKVYNYVKEMKRRIAAYEQTGNSEFLVDIANMALLEFEFPYLPNAHFNNENDHNIHAEPVK